MADLIDKQDALDAVHHAIFEFFSMVEDDGESPMTHNDKRLLELNKAICKRVKGLPPADVVDKERYAILLANAIIVTNALKEYQTADMVKVVRCKDCVHHKDAPKTSDVWCEKIDGLLPRNWFCADGDMGDEEELEITEEDWHRDEWRENEWDERREDG